MRPRSEDGQAQRERESEDAIAQAGHESASKALRHSHEQEAEVFPMALDQNACYEALKSKDERFDGQFFVGVSSTGIYCRPICHAKLPKRQNCTFFESAAQAEAAGYRPCLQCRPELAPGMAPVDSERTLAKKAARRLQEECGSRVNLETLAGKLGYTDRHLRRAFAEEFGITPNQYLQTCRLLLAKQLLTTTDLRVSRIAEMVGFGSTRQFNEVFKKHYSLTPSSLRRGRRAPKANEAIVVELDYRPPFAWDRLLSFLEMRAIPGVEAVRDGAYLRSVHLPNSHGGVARGWISVSPEQGRNRVAVRVSASLLDVISQVIARVRHQFDLDCNPIAIDEGLQGFAKRFPDAYLSGTRLPGCFEAFEMCVRAVLGQQISVKGASTLAGRVAEKFGAPLDTPFEEIRCTFPRAEDIASLGDKTQDELGSLGIVGARTRTIGCLAQAIAESSIDLSYGADPSKTISQLIALPGIGAWTAHYVSMRATGNPDAFPSTDLGVKKALEGLSQKEIEQIAEDWKPWRSYATINLWSH